MIAAFQADGNNVDYTAGASRIPVYGPSMEYLSSRLILRSSILVTLLIDHRRVPNRHIPKDCITGRKTLVIWSSRRYHIWKWRHISTV